MHIFQVMEKSRDSPSAGWGNGAVWVEDDSVADAGAGVLKGRELQ